jgi:hypothetical protein
MPVAVTYPGAMHRIEDEDFNQVVCWSFAVALALGLLLPLLGLSRRLAFLAACPGAVAMTVASVQQMVRAGPPHGRRASW